VNTKSEGLGNWVKRQRQEHKKGKLNEMAGSELNRCEMLKNIGFIFDLSEGTATKLWFANSENARLSRTHTQGSRNDEPMMDTQTIRQQQASTSIFGTAR